MKYLSAFSTFVALGLVACGGDDTSTGTDDVDAASGTDSGGSRTDAGATDATTPVATFSVGGTVSGLTGAGLTLQNNGADDLTVDTTGAFTFTTKVKAGAAFAVTIKTQPAAQTCVVSGGTGTAVAGNVTSVTVNCVASTYTVGGTTSGLAGAGLVLQNDDADDLNVNANGTFAFAKPLLPGSTYAVTVKTQPTVATQVCAVTNGSGTVGTANVTNVGVTCTTQKFKVGGTVTGLVGAGLVLQNNAGDDLSVAANGSFEFTTTVASNANYAITVKTQPTVPSQTCVVTAGAGKVGAADVTTVAVDCTTNTYSVGGNVTGLGGGTVVLKNNAGDDLTRNADGAFAFTTKIASGASYDVVVATHPAGKVCSVTNGKGSVVGAAVTNVAVACQTAQTTCAGILAANAAAPNGMYTIVPAGFQPTEVYCDMVAGGTTSYAVTHNWGEWGANKTMVIRDGLTASTGTTAEWTAACALFGKTNYVGGWKNTGLTYSTPSFTVYADSAAWWTNHAKKVFPSVTYNDILIMQDSTTSDCNAYYAETGSLQSFGSPAGGGYAFCRNGGSATRRYKVYICQ